MDDEIQVELSSGIIRQENDLNNNEQRKTSNIPTLMITVKNEMAHSVNIQTTSANGKIIHNLIMLIIHYVI